MAPKKKEERIAGAEAGDVKAETEKELVIATLKSRLGRYQEAGERLAVEGFKLTDELAKQKLTLQDINEFLTNELKARSVATTQLEERVVALTARLQEVQKEAQADVARTKAEAAAEVAAAGARAAELSAQLEGSSEFLQQREALEGQLAALRAALAAKTKEVEQKLSDLERRHLQEKERARQEVAAKIRETKIAMAQLADQHLEGSTKRTLAENQAMAAQLAYHEAASARLVEAHTAARADAAELRRQLGVAHKTVESTARKNLLLQQTIKAILRCLQQEGVAPAAAAAAAGSAAAMASSSRAASPLSMGAVGEAAAAAPAGVQQLQQCISFSLDAQPEAAGTVAAGNADAVVVEPADAAPGQSNHTSGSDEQQQQQQQQQHADGLLPSQSPLLPASANQQESEQQQQLQEVCAGLPAVPCVAGDIVQQLQQRVLQLGDDLAAARQALAAALQGLMPEGCLARVVVLPGAADSTAAAAAGGVAHSASPGAGDRSSHVLWGEGVTAAEPGRAHSPQQQEHQHRSALQDTSSPGAPLAAGWNGSRNGGSRVSQPRSRSGSPVNLVRQRAASSRASTVPDGSSPLKSSAGDVTGAAALSAALDDGVAAFVLHCIQQLRRGSAASPSMQRQQQHGSRAASPCSSPASRSRSYAALSGGEQGEAAASAALREQLARLLLDELHSYAHHKVAAFAGLGLALPELAGGQGEGGQAEWGSEGKADVAVDSADAAGAAVGGRPREAGSGETAVDWAACREAASTDGWLPQQLSWGHEQLQVLQPLPTLLSMAQTGTAASRTATPGYGPPGCAASPLSGAAPAAGCAYGSASSSNTNQLRLSTEDLFSAVLADVRPWGGSSSSSLGASQLIGAARLPGGSVAAQSAQTQQQQQRSRTPTSPAGAQQSSSAVGGARSPKLLSPKPLSPKHAHPSSSCSSRGGAGSASHGMCGSLSPSAGRLARAAEAAGSAAADGALSGALQVQGKPGAL